MTKRTTKDPADCNVCKTEATMQPAKVPKRDTPGRVIGVILLVSSILGAVVGGMMIWMEAAFSSSFAPNSKFPDVYSYYSRPSFSRRSAGA